MDTLESTLRSTGQDGGRFARADEARKRLFTRWNFDTGKCGELPDHYRRLGCMMPWIGERYEHHTHRKLLVLCESYNFPSRSTIHRNIYDWYHKVCESDLGPALNQDGLWTREWEWICPMTLWGQALKESPSGPYWDVYRQVVSEVHAFLGNPYGLNWVKTVEDMAFCNYFHRPAPTPSGGFKAGQLDKEVAFKLFKWYVCALKPDIVAFASLAAWKAYLWSTNRNGRLDPAIYCAATAHPARGQFSSRHFDWCDPTKEYYGPPPETYRTTGQERFRHILAHGRFKTEQ